MAEIKTIRPPARNVNERRAAAPATEPEPTAATPAPATPPELPPLGERTLTDIHPLLCKPFPLAVVDVKPGAVTKDRARALALAYVDARAYQTRLDRLAGPAGWSVRYTPTGDGRSIICALTILAVTKEDVGECDAGDENQATSAAMQAFKRACAAFGMGRYLYALPQPWCDYDGDRKQFRDAAGVARLIYEQAGLLSGSSAS